jgi:hypothetical protein
MVYSESTDHYIIIVVVVVVVVCHFQPSLQYCYYSKKL